MTDTTITTNPSSAAATPAPGARAIQTGGQVSLRWGERLLLRLGVRKCESAYHAVACEGCQLRALCRCAHAEFLAGAASERRIWIALCLCGGVSILYAAYCFFRH